MAIMLKKLRDKLFPTRKRTKLMQKKSEDIYRIVRGLSQDLEETRLGLYDLLTDKFQSKFKEVFSIETDHPFAYESNDYKHPKGSKNDNTRHLGFVFQVEKLLKKPIYHVDLGCSGGGLVLDFLKRGHQSFGIEGSDYPLRTQRGMWRVIPNRLFTADVTKPFTILDAQGQKISFDLITAWEVLEHLPEDSIDQFLSIVRKNMNQNGLFIGSIALEADSEGDIEYHQCVKPQSWWFDKFKSHGFEPVENSGLCATDYVRGGDNKSCAFDFNLEENPEFGFHVVMRAT